MKTIRIFISSPGDVAEERQIAGKVLERLQGKYWSFVRLDDVFWENKAVRATAHYQDELIDPSECEIVAGILWSRLGSPLPEKFAKLTGRAQTGTEWELEQAFDGYAKALADGCDPQEAKPDILIYRRLPAPSSLTDDGALQLGKLEAYFRENYFHADGTIRRPILTYQDLGDFEKKFTLHVEELILRQIPKLQPGFEPPPISGSPFKGLAAFEFEDADRFFGRNRQIREVQQRLLERAQGGTAFVLIYGASGYGKSSLMKAGLAPTICRPGGAMEGMDSWRRVLMQPSQGAGPLCEKLARALMLGPTAEEEEWAKMKTQYPRRGVPELRRARLRSGQGTWDEASLARVLADAEEHAMAIADVADALAEMGVHLLLMVDQLEEVFNEGVTEQEREAFFRALHGFARSRRVWVVATMRSEYFPRIAAEHELRRLVGKEGGYILPPPDLQSLSEIIRFPVLAARLGYERVTEPRKIGGQLTSEDWLHEQILDDTREDTDALPLLEFCLERLYERRRDNLLTWDAYEAMGGLPGSIATTASEVYGALDEAAKGARDIIFGNLVRVGDTVTRRRADLRALEARPGAVAFLRAFREAKLLVTDEQGGMARVTLAHESLLTHWPLLAQWIDLHRGDLAAQQRFAEQAVLWDQYGRSKKYLLSEGRLAEAERVASSPFLIMDAVQKNLLDQSRASAKRRLRRLQVASVSFAALALMAGCAAYYAKIKQGEALANETLAKQKTVEANSQYERAEKQRELATNTAETLSKTLGVNLFRQGNALLADPHRSHKGLALLARAVEDHQDETAAKRLLLFFQQRATWLAEETSAITPDPAAATSAALPKGFKTPGTKLGNEPGKVGLVVNGPKGLTAVSWQEDLDNENGSQHDGSGLQHFRVWDAYGNAICDWISATPEKGSLQWIGNISGMVFSPDGQYLAVRTWVWREPEFLQVWHLKSGKKIGADLFATGKLPNYQAAVFNDVKFVSTQNESRTESTLNLIAGTSRGDAYWMKLQPDSEDERVMTLNENAVIAHDQAVTAVALGQVSGEVSFISGNDQGLVMAVDEQHCNVSGLFATNALPPPIQLDSRIETITPTGGNGFHVKTSAGNYKISLLAPMKLTSHSAQAPTALWEYESENENHVEIFESGNPKNRIFTKDSKDLIGEIKIADASDSFSIHYESGKVELYLIEDKKCEIKATYDKGKLIMQKDGGAITSDEIGDIKELAYDALNGRLLVMTQEFSYHVLDGKTGKQIFASMNESALFLQGGFATQAGNFALSPGGETLLTKSEHWNPPNVMVSWTTLWDCHTGEAISDRTTDFSEEAIPFLIDANSAVLNSYSGAMPVLHNPPKSVHPYLAKLAEVVSRTQLEQNGVLQYKNTKRADAVELLEKIKTTMLTVKTNGER